MHRCTCSGPEREGQRQGQSIHSCSALQRAGMRARSQADRHPHAPLYMQPAKVPRGWQGLPAPGTVCQLLLLLSLLLLWLSLLRLLLSL